MTNPAAAAANGAAAAISNALAAALFAVDPLGLGGVVLRAGSGPVRDGWLARLKALLPTDAPWRRVPLHINDDRLLGGLDLSATLQAGRPIAQRGLLAEADGGVVLLAMAERLSGSTAASLASVLDARQVVVERHGVGVRNDSRLGVVALDEGLDADERTPARLRERLAFELTLNVAPAQAEVDALWTRDDVAAARNRLASVTLSDTIVEGLCAAGLALGVDSIRASMQACRAARAVAALDGRDAVTAQDAALAAALVLAPRATRVPAQSPPDAADDASEAEAPPQAEGAAPEAPPPSDEAGSDESDAESASPDGAVDDMVLEAALASIPSGLLALLALGNLRSPRSSSAGRAGASQAGTSRGRPTGARRGEPRGGARLNLIETLRAAAPWQALRRREAAASGRECAALIQVRREDFHLWRFRQRSETTTLFVVDASGSSALNRLAETKGAVELLLADCYVRRDSVAVIAFRGKGAELLLPPTRSLVRAKRSLAGLPGGGGTPLATAIDAAMALADAIQRRGETPILVLLTDGRGNIARDGSPGRQRAGEDALAAARQVRLGGVTALLLDTSPQPQPAAEQLAAAMGAGYLPLPYAGAAALSTAVRLATAAPTSVRQAAGRL